MNTIYRYTPREDISPYELALFLGEFFSKPIDERAFSKLPPELQRHYTEETVPYVPPTYPTQKDGAW